MQDSSEQQLLVSACWLRDDLHQALQSCLPRLEQLLDEGRHAFRHATRAELHDLALQAMQQVEGGVCMLGALHSLLGTGDEPMCSPAPAQVQSPLVRHLLHVLAEGLQEPCQA